MNIFELLNERYIMPEKPKLFEAFAGIGCQRLAFKRLGIEVDMVGISEIDKYAIQSYMAIHGETKNFGSICDIQSLPEIDVFTWSFPCTDLSKAGKQKGLTNTRSGLVYEVLRILHNTEQKPKVLIMENVVDLVQTKFIREFQAIQVELEQMGYTNYTQTLNGKDYGVAQNRDRVFMVSILGEYYYEFPQPFKLEKRLKDYLEDEVDEKYYLSDKMLNFFVENSIKNEEKGNGFRFKPKEETDLANCITTLNGNRMDDNFIAEPIRLGGLYDDEKGKHQAGSIWHKDGISPTIDTAQGGHRQPFIVVPEDTQKGYAEAYDGDGVYINRPHQKRGVVQNQMIQTLKTSGNDVGVVVHDIPQKVEVRKYDVDVDRLKVLLSSHKNMTNKELADELNLPITTVEHWFRKDDCFSIPNADIWFELKELLNIQTEEFDQSITEFEVRDGVYEKSNRVYNSDGLSPTLTSTTPNEKVIHQLRIRKLTPLECWSLMGIDSEDFRKAEKVCSNSQLYKQAGNGIIVDVFATILKGMTK